MGIPNFYPKFCSKYSHCVRQWESEPTDVLAVDVNPLIYRFARDADAAVAAERCASWVSELAAATRCADLLAAVDGGSPPAKLPERKRRRARSELSRTITAGTPWMSEFCGRFFALLRCRRVHSSTHVQTGEGEFKLVRALTKFGPDVRKTVVSIDADVIMLCLRSGLERATVVRLHSNYRHAVDIDALRASVSDHEEWVRLHFALGNDYLPPLVGRGVESFSSFEDLVLASFDHSKGDASVGARYLAVEAWLGRYYSLDCRGCPKPDDAVFAARGPDVAAALVAGWTLPVETADAVEWGVQYQIEYLK